MSNGIFLSTGGRLHRLRAGTIETLAEHILIHQHTGIARANGQKKDILEPYDTRPEGMENEQ